MPPQRQKSLLGLLAPALGPPSALHPLSLRPVDVMRGDPAFIIGHSARSNSRPISAENRDLVGWVDLLGLAGGPLGSFAAFAATTLLGEEGGDPGAVDEVEGPDEGG